MAHIQLLLGLLEMTSWNNVPREVTAYVGIPRREDWRDGAGRNVQDGCTLRLEGSRYPQQASGLEGRPLKGFQCLLCGATLLRNSKFNVTVRDPAGRRKGELTGPLMAESEP